MGGILYTAADRQLFFGWERTAKKQNRPLSQCSGQARRTDTYLPAAK
jgi:hypothetical protein